MTPPQHIQITVSRKSLLKGALFFIILSLIGLLISFTWKGSRDLVSIIRGGNGWFLAAMFLLIGIDWFLSGYRIFLFTEHMSERIRFWDCFRANIASTCLGAVTPSQTGAGAAQIYILNRAGLSIASGMVITVLTFLSTLLFLLVSAVMVIVFSPSLYTGGIAVVIRYSFAIFGLATFLFLLCLVRPDIAFRFSKRLQRFTADYQEVIRFFITQRKTTLLHCLFVTFVLYFNKFLIAYAIVRALGIQAPFWSVIFSQVLLLFINYFAPSPGASGIAEISATLLMASLIPPAMTPYFALLWRFANTYLEFGIGGWVLGTQIRRDLSSTLSGDADPQSPVTYPVRRENV